MGSTHYTFCQRTLHTTALQSFVFFFRSFSHNIEIELALIVINGITHAGKLFNSIHYF